MKDVHEQQINLTLEMWGLVYRLLYITPSLEVGFFFKVTQNRSLNLATHWKRLGSFLKPQGPGSPRPMNDIKVSGEGISI